MVNNVGTSARIIERRSGFRYPVSVELSYRELRGKKTLMGWGKTINISTSGILFGAEHPLPVDADVELMLRWPVLLNDEVLLHLKANGRVVRTVGNCAAIEIANDKPILWLLKMWTVFLHD